MTADRTQHVLDAIDGALQDWSVSGDAMRWSPEPPTSTPILTLPDGIQPRYRWSPVTIPMTDELLNDWPVQGWFFHHEPENGRLQRAVEEVTDAYREPDLPEPPDRSDVRAHALWRAQHRHTGPQRPTAGQTKRPRRP